MPLYAVKVHQRAYYTALSGIINSWTDSWKWRQELAITIRDAALLVLGLFAAAPSAAACTCVTGDPYDENKALRERRQRAVLVFAGKVVALSVTIAQPEGESL